MENIIRTAFVRTILLVTACSAKSFVQINIEFMQLIAHIFIVIYVYIDVIDDRMETC